MWITGGPYWPLLDKSISREFILFSGIFHPFYSKRNGKFMLGLEVEINCLHLLYGKAIVSQFIPF